MPPTLAPSDGHSSDVADGLRYYRREFQRSGLRARDADTLLKAFVADGYTPEHAVNVLLGDALGRLLHPNLGLWNGDEDERVANVAWLEDVVLTGGCSTAQLVSARSRFRRSCGDVDDTPRHRPASVGVARDAVRQSHRARSRARGTGGRPAVRRVACTASGAEPDPDSPEPPQRGRPEASDHGALAAVPHSRRARSRRAAARTLTTCALRTSGQRRRLLLCSSPLAADSQAGPS